MYTQESNGQAQHVQNIHAKQVEEALVGVPTFGRSFANLHLLARRFLR